MILFGQDDFVGAWVFARVGRGRWLPGEGTAIGWLEEGELVAGLTFTDWTGPNMFVGIAIEGRRFPPALLRVGLLYAFKQVACTRLTFAIASNNLASISLAQRLGAELEASLQGALPDADLNYYVLRPDKCKFWSRVNA